MLVVPLGVIGALLAASLRGLNNDVYFGLASDDERCFIGQKRHLIVEFAKDLMDKRGVKALLRQRWKPQDASSPYPDDFQPLFLASCHW